MDQSAYFARWHSNVLAAVSLIPSVEIIATLAAFNPRQFIKKREAEWLQIFFFCGSLNPGT